MLTVNSKETVDKRKRRLQLDIHTVSGTKPDAAPDAAPDANSDADSDADPDEEVPHLFEALSSRVQSIVKRVSSLIQDITSCLEAADQQKKTSQVKMKELEAEQDSLITFLRETTAKQVRVHVCTQLKGKER